MKGFVLMSKDHRKKRKNDAKYAGVQNVAIKNTRKEKEKPKPTNTDEHETSLMLLRSPNRSPTRGTWFLVDPAARCDWRGSRPHLEGEEPWEGGVYWSTRSRKGGGGEEKLWTHRSATTVTWSNTHGQKKSTYPRNWAPVGPTSMMRPARPSPSTIGGMEARRCLFTSLHVTRVGAEHFLGGTMIRRPLWRQPRIAPPLASTMKLTRKLKEGSKKTWNPSGFNIMHEQLSFVQCGFLCSIMRTKRRTLQNTPPVFFAEKRQQS